MKNCFLQAFTFLLAAPFNAFYQIIRTLDIKKTNIRNHVCLFSLCSNAYADSYFSIKHSIVNVSNYLWLYHLSS